VANKERKEKQELPVLRGNKDQRGRLGKEAQRVYKAIKDPKEQPELKGFKGQRANKDQRVLRE
jgi:hypothetical protein